MPRILRLRGVLALVPLGRSCVYDMVQRGEFPPPIKLTERAVGWAESDVKEWIDARIAGRKWTRRDEE